MIKHDLGGNGAEAYYTEHTDPALVALDPEIDRLTEEARRVEAEGYYRRRPPKGGRKWCFTPRHDYDFDTTAINAIRSVIDDLRPEWVEEVKDAARISNDPRWISAYLDLSANVVVAIVRNLIDRGEIELDLDYSE